MKLNKEILRLAVPSILANITIPLVGMVDLAVVGHLDGEGGFAAATLLGGIAIGTTIFDLVYWCFGFLRAGTGGVTAQAFGRGDREGQAMALARSLGIALAAGLLLILLQWVIFNAAFLFIKCSPEVRTLARQYFYIRIWAAPATLSLFALKGWFIGMQDTVHPMAADLIVNGVNIATSILLGYGLWIFPHLGFRGVAVGTVVAQWTGFLFALLVLRLRYRHVFRGYRLQDTFHGSLRPFFAMNSDLFVRSLGLIAVYIGFTVISARYGDMMLAVSSIIMKLLMIFSYFTDGFAFAGEALTGRFIGERNQDGLRSTVRGVFAWSAVVVVLFLAVYAFAGTPIFRLMTSDESVVAAGAQFLPWLLAMPLIGCPAFIWDGIFIGATASADMRNSSVLCALGFFAAWFLGLLIAGRNVSQETAIHILMAAYFVHLAVRTIYLSVRYKSQIKI
ncbi:MAG: MATE family efflux transporter [Bacteroidales bacterium]|nr:MATE family efflux transporter [Bacteroidales bacterium]